MNRSVNKALVNGVEIDYLAAGSGETVVFDVETLRAMSPAFGGTVTKVDGTVATLEVDRWYAGGDAETVEISFIPEMEALIGTPTFEVGQQYLITATDGVVNGCGYSGLATPDYQAAFAEAFGA